MNSTAPFVLEKVPAMGLFERILYGLIVATGIFLTLLFGFWWFSSSHVPKNFIGRTHYLDIALFIVLSYIVWYQVINEVFLWTVGLVMKHPISVKPEENKRVAFLTAYVPEKEPLEVLEKALKAMKRVEYPHDTWVLDEGNSNEVKALCKRIGVHHYTRFGKRRFNRPSGKYKAKTKGGNYNSWYALHGDKYDYVAQIDVDFVPKKSFLMKTLGYFRDPTVGFVGSPQIYGNTDASWIAQGAAEQAYGFYGTIQKGLFSHDMQLFIGANHVIRVSAHDSIEGYSGHIVEDHLTGMKLYAKRWKSVYVPEILAVGEGPSTFDAYFSQQMRWAYGLLDIFFRHSPRLFLKMKPRHIVHYFMLQQYYFFGLTQFLGIVLLSLYFFFGIQSTSMKFSELVLFFGPLLLLQQIIFLWLQRHNIDPDTERGFMLRAKLLNLAVWPIYLVALLGVIIGKRLTYKVTPKGEAQTESVSLIAFLPHFILGIVSAAGLIISFSTHHQAIQQIFWALINAITLLYFVLSETAKRLVLIIENAVRSIYFALPKRVAPRILPFDLPNLFS